MPKNYLIGIGGTGARVIEAAVYLCAAGYGPDELNIFLIDPDAGNGNLTRTKKLITNYMKCRKNLQKLDTHKIFKTNIKIPPDEKGLVWEIFADKDTTLSSWINYVNMRETKTDIADFASILFTENELETQLNEGFRGHPSIGAVVMASLDIEKQPFKMLFDDLSENKKANDVRVFFVGSVFGGTGAAGFPTLGSKPLIKYHPKAQLSDNVSQILMGGALVLPYFSFDLDSDAEKLEKMFVNTSDFPIATKAALQYYHEKDLGFDQIYFIGDSLAQKVGKFGVGSKKQENLPHYIEVVSSLAAFDFYEQPDIKGEAEKMLFTAIRDNDKVNWSDLPISRLADSIRPKQNELKKLIINMSVFAYSYLTYGKKILATNHKEIKDAWYLDNFRFNEKDDREKTKDPRQTLGKEILDDYDKFLYGFLFWIAALDDNSGKVELIDKTRIFSEELQVDKMLAILNPDIAANLLNISLLIKNEKSKNADFNEFKTRGLNSVEFNDKRISEAASKFINIFYEAAVLYAKINYNIS